MIAAAVVAVITVTVLIYGSIKPSKGIPKYLRVLSDGEIDSRDLSSQGNMSHVGSILDAPVLVESLTLPRKSADNERLALPPASPHRAADLKLPLPDGPGLASVATSLAADPWTVRVTRALEH